MTNLTPQQVTKDLGGKWGYGYGVAPCPVCQPERRRDQNALTVGGDDASLLLHCKKLGCDFKDILGAAGYTTATPQIDKAALAQAKLDRVERIKQAHQRARSVWGNARTIGGTKGEVYLRARGITCDIPESLRWSPDVYHGPSGQYCAAIVADVAPTGGVHRTFFTKQGRRLEKSAKMMLGPCAGGGVVLSDASGPLVVCEGIETGLSLMSGLVDGPHGAIAALSTSGLRAINLPAEPRDLIIATDGDKAGFEAGVALAGRAFGLGWNVSTLPAPDGMDWNDVLQGGAAA